MEAIRIPTIFVGVTGRHTYIFISSFIFECSYVICIGLIKYNQSYGPHVLYTRPVMGIFHVLTVSYIM